MESIQTINDTLDCLLLTLMCNDIMYFIHVYKAGRTTIVVDVVVRGPETIVDPTSRTAGATQEVC